MNILWIGLGSIDRAATGPIIWTTFLSWSTKPLIVHTFRLFCIFTCLYEMYRVYSLTCCEILLRTKYKPLLLSLMLLCAVLKRVPILSYPMFIGTFLTFWVPIYFSSVLNGRFRSLFWLEGSLLGSNRGEYLSHKI